ncbi:MAG: DUF362 domain-containing protein [Elusimicrobiaceae bacterium]|nr:DUF362 domain-containing protein [Elusimicrobiaceae bacterium]
MSCVSIEKAAGYDRQIILDTVRKSFANLGGVEKFIKPGMTVVLKPNLVLGKTPETAATTHPELVRAVGQIVRQAGARAVLAESPGGPYTPQRLKAVYTTTGMTGAAQDAGIELNYDTSSRKLDNPAGKYLKKTEIITPLAEADVIINLCKLKTHGQMVYTGAAKNMFGAVPGILKAEYHMRMPEYDRFADTLIDIFLSVRPALSIMDGVVAMEGCGPTAGTPRQAGLILASEDAFALDLSAAAIIGAEPDAIPMLRQARLRGLAPQSLDAITFPAETPETVRVRDFVIPQLDHLRAVDFLKNNALLSALSEKLRPYPVFTGQCVKCGDCVRACPVSVIRMGKNRPCADLGKCIRCFCCQELCPAKAVKMERHPLARALLRAVEVAMSVYNLIMPAPVSR